MKKQWISSVLASSLALTLCGLPVVGKNQDTSPFIPQYTQTLSDEESPSFWFELNSSGGIKIKSGYGEDTTEITVPSSIGGVTVSAIQNRGLYGLTEVTSMTIPSSVSVIGDEAFANCSSLEFLLIPSSVVSIGDDILSGSSAAIYTPDGSYAANYCLENNITVHLLLEEAPQVDSTPDTEPEPEVEAPFNPAPEDVYIPENGKLALPSSAKVEIDKKSVDFPAYNIEGFNYFRLTDLAYALTGTTAQYNVVWDAEKGAINIVTGSTYSVNGDEFQAHGGINTAAEPFSSDTYIDGVKSNVAVYIIDGKSYFRLDDLGKILDFTLGYEYSTNTISLTTPEAPLDLVDAYVQIIGHVYKLDVSKTHLVLDFTKAPHVTEEQQKEITARLTQNAMGAVTVVVGTEESLRNEGLLSTEIMFGIPFQYFAFGTLYTLEHLENTEDGFTFKIGEYLNHMTTEYEYGTVITEEDGLGIRWA